jgi:glycosyltransferase involved in cell wall biosynthesis
VTIHRLPCRFEVVNGGQVILKGLRKTLKELEPDVVQAYGTLTPLAILAVWYSRELGFKVFVDDHSHAGNFKTDSVLKKMYVRVAVHFYLIYEKRVFCWKPTTCAARPLLVLLKVPEERIETTYLRTDTNRFTKSEEHRQIGRAQIDVGDKAILLITSGKFNESKDIDVLVKAFFDIASKRDDVYLLLLGNGSSAYMQQIRSLIKSSDVGQKILFRDFVPNAELSLYHNAADPGIWPGIPAISVIEAIATGLPEILPEEELAYDLLFKKDSAIGFERVEPASLSHNITNLLCDVGLKSKIATNCSSLVANTLLWRCIAQRSVAI